MGIGFECVSIQEVKHILSLFPTIDKTNILFTPNFATKEEYQEGFELGVFVTLDNMHPILNWQDICKNKQVFLRIDCGKGSGHSKKVKTAGVASKFGIPTFRLDEIKVCFK